MKNGKLLALSTSLVIALSFIATGCDNKKESDGEADPSNYYNEEAKETGYDWGNVEIVGGGFIPGIVYNETEEGLAYVKTDIGGAYKLNKDTKKWECITDFFGKTTKDGQEHNDWNYNCIESIATDPIDTNRVYMSCGTSYGGKGAIFYSYDYGKNWTKANIKEMTMGGNDWGRNTGERLMVDPNDNSIVYYATHADGIFVSENYGKDWKKLESFPENVGTYTEEGYTYGVMWIAFDKSSAKKGEKTQTIFCGVAEKTDPKIYCSKDGGESWKAIENEFTDGEKTGFFCQQGKVSSSGDLYVTYANMITQEKQPTDGAVCKYNIKDEKWTEITPKITGAWCALSLYKDDMVAVATICHWAPQDNICISQDGGETWNGLQNIETGSKDYDLDISVSPWLYWQGQLKLGWWTSALAINPFNPDEVLYGTGATIYGLNNATKIGSEKINISVKADGIEETAIFDIYAPKKVDDSTPALYSTLGDLYGFTHTDVTKSPEEHWGAQQFAATSLSVAAQNPNVVVRTTKDKTFENPVCYSTDATKTWKFCTTLPGGFEDYSGSYATVSSDGKTLLYSCDSSTEVYYTTDWGKTWGTVKGLTSNSKFYADQVNAKKFYAQSGGTIYISEDGGKTFTLLKEVLVSNFSIATANDKEGDLWLANGNVFYMDTTKGTDATLTAVSDNVQQAQAISLGKAEKDGDYMTIYIIGECNNEGFGIYRSTDKGKSWKRIDDNTKNWGNMNSTICADPNVFGRVYISTNGRGIIMGNVKD